VNSATWAITKTNPELTLREKPAAPQRIHKPTGSRGDETGPTTNLIGSSPKLTEWHKKSLAFLNSLKKFTPIPRIRVNPQKIHGHGKPNLNTLKTKFLAKSNKLNNEKPKSHSFSSKTLSQVDMQKKKIGYQ
jgi:hypothetical protein